ncbi:NADH-quinone oxidoreductase subunit J [Larkinella harenae]
MVQIIFYILILFSLGSALAILLTKNALYAAFFLLLTLLGVAGLFVLAGADFLAASQIMIYVGGVLVLIIFGVMLTHKADVTQTDYAQPNHILTKHRSWLWALLVAGGIFSILYRALVHGNFVLLNQGVPAYRSTVDTIGRQLMTEFLIPFEIAGVLLLIALIGATTIAAASRNK